MVKYQLTRSDGPFDYPTLGFRAAQGAILDGSLFTPPITNPPDVFWTVYTGGSAQSGITPIHPNGTVNPSALTPEDYIPLYNRSTGTYVPTAPAEVFAKAGILAALTDTFAGIAVAHVMAPGVHPLGDQVAIQAACDALPSTGGEVRLQRGVYNVTTITTSKPVALIGQGGGLQSNTPGSTPRGQTTIRSASATADCLVLSGAGSVVRDLLVVNEAATTPTAGRGIRAAANSNGHMLNVTVLGFYDCIDLSGQYWVVDGCQVFDPVRYGIRTRATSSVYHDHGDFRIVNTVVTSFLLDRDADTAIRWESGGGVNIIGCKINGAAGNAENIPNGKFFRGIEIVPVDTVSTVDLAIIGNRVSNCRDHGIYLGVGGTVLNNGSMRGGVIADNGIDANLYGIGIYVHSTGLGGFRDLYVGGNIFSGVSGGCIIIDRASGVGIGPNTYRQLGGAAPIINIKTGTGDVAVDMGAQLIVDDNGGSNDYHLILDDSSNDYSSHGKRARIKHEYVREVPTCTSTSTYVNLFRFDPADYSSGIFEVVISGQITTLGAATRRAQRAFVANNVGGAVTLTTLGTDLLVGDINDFDLALDVATNGRVTVKMRLNSTWGGTDFTGRATLRIDGQVRRVFRSATAA